MWALKSKVSRARGSCNKYKVGRYYVYVYIYVHVPTSLGRETREVRIITCNIWNEEGPREGERWRETETAWRAGDREAKSVLCLGRCTGRGKSDSDIISWLLLGISVGRSVDRPASRSRSDRTEKRKRAIRESETVKTVAVPSTYIYSGIYQTHKL